MIYRALGSTGMEASIIGLGLEHVDGKPYEVVEETIGEAIRQGVNMMDCFMPGRTVRQHVGRALRGRRRQVHLQGMIGSVDLREQYDISRDLDTCKRYFEDLLRYLETDYIDCGMLFFIDSQQALDDVQRNGIYDYALRLRAEGALRAIGASSHNPLIAKKMVDQGMVETLLFSINPAFDMTPEGAESLDMLEDLGSQQLKGVDPARGALYLACQSRGVGITVMKTLGAGKLLRAEHSPFGRALSVGQCIHYALSRPGVASVLLGCASAAEVREACGYLSMSEEEKDYSGIIEGRTGAMKGACVYCSHCQPCPAGIDIAALHRYLDIARLDPDHVPPSIRQHYRALEARGSDCIQCGSCESRCPFQVRVIDNMAQAAQVFGD